MTTLNTLESAETVSIHLGKQSQRVYRPELDALRFFAFFAVLLHHVVNLSPNSLMMRQPVIGKLLPLVKDACGFGLSLFFFLSSYLITSLLVIERERTGTVNLKKFYLRRTLRIWPLYFLFLGFAFCLGLFWTKYRIEPMRLFALSFLAGNWYSVFFGTGTLTVFQLWSISIEEQFYLVWPSIARATSKRKLILLCIAICVIAIVTSGLLIQTGSSTIAVWCNSLVESLFFAAGAWMALSFGITQRKHSLMNAGIGICGGLGIWLGAAQVGGLTNHIRSTGAWHVAIGYALVALGCGLIMWGFLYMPLYLLPRPLIYLGRISYGLYVFHGLAIIIVENSLAKVLPAGGASILAELGIAILLAAISYQYLEKPFLNLKSRFEVIHTRAA